MQDVHKKVAYLQGLMAGMEVGTTTKEGRILNEVITILGNIADNLNELQINQTELESYMETIDEDLYDLEEDFFDADLDEELDDDDFVEVKCPDCEDIVYFDADLLAEDEMLEVTCPHCEAVVYSNEGDFEMSHGNLGIEEDL